MEKFYMKLAERTIAVSANFATTKKYCKDYILEEVPVKVDIEVSVSKDAIVREREAMTNMYHEGFSDEYLETLVVQRRITECLIKYDVILFHGSAVALDGEVYLFTAPSGTGKSTHARLWRRGVGERIVMVNDDKPFLGVKEDGTVMVYGSPWDGKHKLNENVALPLKAICILSQAKENKIKILSAGDAFQTIYTQTYRKSTDAQFMDSVLNVLGRIMEYPIWKLECNISKEAFILSYETMTGEKWEET